jgi:hypothetical protein
MGTFLIIGVPISLIALFLWLEVRKDFGGVIIYPSLMISSNLLGLGLASGNLEIQNNIPLFLGIIIATITLSVYLIKGRCVLGKIMDYKETFNVFDSFLFVVVVHLCFFCFYSTVMILKS